MESRPFALTSTRALTRLPCGGYGWGRTALIVSGKLKIAFKRPELPTSEQKYETKGQIKLGQGHQFTVG